MTTEDFRELDYRVMRYAFDSQNEIGRLADERIYQSDLAARLASTGMKACREVQVLLTYRDFTKSLYLDLVVANKGVYELKAAKAITSAHRGQLLTYLLLLDLERGKLVNFGGSNVESEFVNAPLTTAKRRSFQWDESEYDGDSGFRTLVHGLLRDWGTSLALSLYQEAIVTMLGGIERVQVMHSIRRNEVPLGNQRFHLAAPRIAFKLTALPHDAGN